MVKWERKREEEERKRERGETDMARQREREERKRARRGRRGYCAQGKLLCSRVAEVFACVFTCACRN